AGHSARRERVRRAVQPRGGRRLRVWPEPCAADRRRGPYPRRTLGRGLPEGDLRAGVVGEVAVRAGARARGAGAGGGLGSARALRGGSAQMKSPKLPEGAIQPRPAVVSMAPYSPPTAGRAGKLRLDFNENTVGCSPKVIEALKAGVEPGGLAVYPEYETA